MKRFWKCCFKPSSWIISNRSVEEVIGVDSQIGRGREGERELPRMRGEGGGRGEGWQLMFKWEVAGILMWQSQRRAVMCCDTKSLSPTHHLQLQSFISLSADPPSNHPTVSLYPCLHPGKSLISNYISSSLLGTLFPLLLRSIYSSGGFGFWGENELKLMMRIFSTDGPLMVQLHQWGAVRSDFSESDLQ